MTDSYARPARIIPVILDDDHEAGETCEFCLNRIGEECGVHGGEVWVDTPACDTHFLT